MFLFKLYPHVETVAKCAKEQKIAILDLQGPPTGLVQIQISK